MYNLGTINADIQRDAAGGLEKELLRYVNV